MKHHHDTDKAQRRHQHVGGRHLKTGRIVRVKLQDVVSGTLGASAAASGSRSRCGTSLSGLSGKMKKRCVNQGIKKQTVNSESVISKTITKTREYR
jgi:hypothetical protein